MIDFILEDSSPIKLIEANGHTRKSLGGMYNHPDTTMISQTVSFMAKRSDQSFKAKETGLKVISNFPFHFQGL